MRHISATATEMEAIPWWLAGESKLRRRRSRLKEDSGGVSEMADTREKVEESAKEEKWGGLSEERSRSMDLVLIFCRS